MLTIKPLPQNVSELPVDFEHLNRALIQGCFREETIVAGKTRSFISYLPENIEYCQRCIVVCPPSDENPLEFLENSGLKELADRQKLYIFLMEKDGDNWKTDGTDADFMNAVYVKIQARDYYVTMQDNIYACGIGDGAVIAHKAVQKAASEWSGLFSFGELSVPLDSEGAVGGETQEQGNAELKIYAQKAQVPVWMVAERDSENLQSAIEYWKKENHVAENPYSGQGADQIWMPVPMRKYSEINEEQIAQVRITIGDAKPTIDALNMVWEYIGLARRHRGFGRKNLRYFKDPIACGATRHEMTFEGMTRVWYEYVPAACTPDKRWPLVLCMHGRGGTAETFYVLPLYRPDPC